LRNRALILANYCKKITSDWLIKTYNLTDELSWSVGELYEFNILRELIIDTLENNNIMQNIEKVNYYLSTASFKHNIMVSNNKIIHYHTSDDSINEQLMSKIASDLIKLFNNSTSKGIKRCLNPECKMYFVDNSKNNSKKYCSSRCNNLIKVRRFREKNGHE